MAGTFTSRNVDGKNASPRRGATATPTVVCTALFGIGPGSTGAIRNWYLRRTMWGRFLLEARRETGGTAYCEARLQSVIEDMQPAGRRILLQGLLRPTKILIACYTAPAQRCCPLTAAVWEATGREVTTRPEIWEGLARLGLADQHQRFLEAYDSWATIRGHAVTDRDGAVILNNEGRRQLIALVEQQIDLAAVA
ncbi:MAG: hypothetical protein ACJ740_18690 [Gaiellales bacterium]